MLYGSAMIFLFVLAVGAFITVTMKTEAIQTGIGRLALRFQNSGPVLIGILMCVFALGGTSYGMWEETLGFFVLLVPLTLALGYDRLVAASIIFLGAGSGVLCSTVNPFATGVAVRRGRHQPGRRDWPADRHVGRDRRDGDRLRDPLRAAGARRTRRGRSSASRPPTPRRRVG